MRPKQTKKYKKERFGLARELVLKQYNTAGLSLLRRNHLRGENKKRQSEIVLFLINSGFRYEEIGRLARKKRETVWYIAAKAKKAEKNFVFSKVGIIRKAKEEVNFNKENLVYLSKATQNTPYTNGYWRVLLESKKVKGKKEKGRWFVDPKEIEKYLKKQKLRTTSTTIDKEWKKPTRASKITTHESGNVNLGLLDFVGDEDKKEVEAVPARSFKPLLVPLLILLLLLTPVLASPALRSKVKNALTPTSVLKLVQKEEDKETEEKKTVTETTTTEVKETRETEEDAVERANVVVEVVGGDIDETTGETVSDPLASYSPTSGSILMGDGSSWDSTSTTSITKVGTINSGAWNGDEIDISDYTNLTAGDNISLSDDTLNVDDSFLLNTGDTGSGDYTFNGDVTVDTLIFGDNTNETTLTVTEPTTDRTITFPNASGEVTLLGQDLTTTTGTTSTTSSNSGLETTDEGVRIVGGCSDDQILKWDSTANTWNCEADTGGGATQLTDLSDVNTSTPTNNNILMADGTDWESTPQTSIT